MMHPEILAEARRQYGQFIRERREEKGMSYLRLAEITGLQRTQIYKIERGEGNYTIDTFHTILQALNINVSLIEKD